MGVFCPHGSQPRQARPSKLFVPACNKFDAPGSIRPIFASKNTQSPYQKALVAIFSIAITPPQDRPGSPAAPEAPRSRAPPPARRSGAPACGPSAWRHTWRHRRCAPVRQRCCHAAGTAPCRRSGPRAVPGPAEQKARDTPPAPCAPRRGPARRRPTRAAARRTHRRPVGTRCRTRARPLPGGGQTAPAARRPHRGPACR